MRLAEIPSDAVQVRTYKDFERYLRGWVDGHYPFLWVQGRTGLSKSESMKAAIEGTNAVILGGGQLTPLAFYAACYRHKDCPIILDDAEHVANKPPGDKLLSALGEHTEEKLLRWLTSNKWLETQAIPQVFRTRSRLCIIANYPTKHIALQSRARLIYFRPTAREVHELAGKWVQDREVYEYIGANLDRIDPDKIDVRKMYNHLSQDRAAGLDWKKNFYDQFCYGKDKQLVLRLSQDANLTPAQRIARFIGETGQSKATFYNLRNDLIDDGQLEPSDERGKHRHKGKTLDSHDETKTVADLTGEGGVVYECDNGTIIIPKKRKRP